MKNLLFLFLALVAFSAKAQQKNALDTLAIRTTTVCDMCVNTIESNLIYEKGVKKVRVDLAASIIHVEYDGRKNTPDALRNAVAKLGYQADDVPADPKAFSELPACCQKEGCGQPTKPGTIPHH